MNRRVSTSYDLHMGDLRDVSAKVLADIGSQGIEIVSVVIRLPYHTFLQEMEVISLLKISTVVQIKDRVKREFGHLEVVSCDLGIDLKEETEWPDPPAAS